MSSRGFPGETHPGPTAMGGKGVTPVTPFGSRFDEEARLRSVARRAGQ